MILKLVEVNDDAFERYIVVTLYNAHFKCLLNLGRQLQPWMMWNTMKLISGDLLHPH